MILLIDFWKGFLACFALFAVSAFITWLILFAGHKDKPGFYDWDEIGRDPEDNIFNQF
jgi:hypothetical protein